jgi:crotonobetainyl-CoA:carnitine CoA-transferase CaiB-like acyl-CoA transferase
MKFNGIRVLDLSNFLPGPYLTLAMADHGADVLKVETPQGDPARHIAPMSGSQSQLFRNLNRGKKSLVLNLKSGADRARFLRLAQKADVMVESFRPGVVDRLGIGYAQLRVQNPRIIYCSISAFGQDGPYAKRAAHDLAVEALSGVLSMNVGSDGQAVLPAIPFADIAAGLQGLAAIAMALYARERSGNGDHIDISMQEALVSATVSICGSALLERRQPIVAHGRTTGGAAFYNIYDTADGRQIVLAGVEPKFVVPLLQTLNRADLIGVCEQGPGPHQAPLLAFLRETFRQLTYQQAADLLGRVDACWGSVNSLVEALDDPQLAARRFMLTDEGGKRYMGSPIRFRNEPAAPDLRSPELNQHGAATGGDLWEDN